MNIAIIADPIESLKIKKDTTIGMIRYFLNQGDSCVYSTPHQISKNLTGVHIEGIVISPPESDALNWYQYQKIDTFCASEFDVLIIRKDPPCDLAYQTMLHLLVSTEKKCVVVNSASGILSCNEKMETLFYPKWAPPSLVSSSIKELLAFIGEYRDVIVKPLWRMGGSGIFRIKKDDSNTMVILETLLSQESKILIQSYLSEISDGDRRSFIVDGTPFDKVLVRVPAKHEHRANLASGGSWYEDNLSDTDRQICDDIGPYLQKQGILFAGLDIIGDRLTEINVTSPTCIRELNLESQNRFYALLYNRITEKILK